MATESRRGPAPLTEELIDEGWRFNFFQAVRLLQLMDPESTPLGTGDDPAREAVRFSSRISLSFPPSDIHEISPPEDDEDPHTMLINFMGLASPSSFGSLPLPYTELILGKERNKDFALKEFLDLFNHRLISLFYRAWEKYRYAFGYERTERQGPEMFEQALLSVMGIGTGGLQGRMAVNDRALLARAHAVGGRGISALGLSSLIRDYFKVPAEVVQFIPSWYEIEDSEVCRLGVQSCHLGEDMCLGSRVRMAQSRFGLRLGPLSWNRMVDFLPNGSAFHALAETCSLVTGPQFDFEFHLKLASGQTPPLRLGVADESGSPWLGWSTWLRRSDEDSPPAEVIIDGEISTVDLPMTA